MGLLSSSNHFLSNSFVSSRITVSGLIVASAEQEESQDFMYPLSSCHLQKEQDVFGVTLRTASFGQRKDGGS